MIGRQESESDRGFALLASNAPDASSRTLIFVLPGDSLLFSRVTRSCSPG